MDVSCVMPLLQDLETKPDLPNTRNKQRIRQNEEDSFQNSFEMSFKWRNKIKPQKNQVEICNLPNEEFKVMIIKMLHKLRKRMHEHIEKFNKEL